MAKSSAWQPVAGPRKDILYRQRPPGMGSRHPTDESEQARPLMVRIRSNLDAQTLCLPIPSFPWSTTSSQKSSSRAALPNCSTRSTGMVGTRRRCCKTENSSSSYRAALLVFGRSCQACLTAGTQASRQSTRRKPSVGEDAAPTTQSRRRQLFTRPTDRHPLVRPPANGCPRWTWPSHPTRPPRRGTSNADWEARPQRPSVGTALPVRDSRRSSRRGVCLSSFQDALAHWMLHD